MLNLKCRLDLKREMVGGTIYIEISKTYKASMSFPSSTASDFPSGNKTKTPLYRNLYNEKNTSAINYYRLWMIHKQIRLVWHDLCRSQKENTHCYTHRFDQGVSKTCR